MKVKPKKPRQLGKQEEKIAKIDLSKVNETKEEVKEDNVAKVDLQSSFCPTTPTILSLNKNWGKILLEATHQII